MHFFKTTLASATLLAGGLLVATPEQSDAQVRFSFGTNSGYGRSYYGNSGYGSRYNGYGYRNYGHNDGFVGRGSRGWHDTSHYDYHPTTVTPHGNHYHVTPGHYDYHRSGHYDYYGGHRGHNH